MKENQPEYFGEGCLCRQKSSFECSALGTGSSYARGVFLTASVRTVRAADVRHISRPAILVVESGIIHACWCQGFSPPAVEPGPPDCRRQSAP
jgi:hypothetical protein